MAGKSIVWIQSFDGLTYYIISNMFDLQGETITVNGRNYLMERKLGQGSGGIVFQALQMQTKTECAIKILPYSKNKEILKYIATEIQLLRQFHHKNIIKYISDQWVKDKCIYLVMEMCQMNLKVFTEVYGDQGTLSEKQTISIGVEILKGLSQLHSKKILHRDLKTENILYKQGVWKLSDFGIAIKLDDEEKTQTLLGTPYYLAPEVLNNQQYSYKVDIWCFGIILFEMFFGQVPFYKEEMASPMELLDIIHYICRPRFDFRKVLINYQQQKVDQKVIDHAVIKQAIATPLLMDLFTKIFVVQQQDRLSFYGLSQHGIIKQNCPNTYVQIMEDANFYCFLENVKMREFYTHQHLDFLLKTVQGVRQSSQPQLTPSLKGLAIHSLQLAITYFNNTKYRNKFIEMNPDLVKQASESWDTLKNKIREPLAGLYQVLKGCTKLPQKKLQLQVLICIKGHHIFATPQSFSTFFKPFFSENFSLIEFDHFLSNIRTRADVDKLVNMINHLLLIFCHN